MRTLLLIIVLLLIFGLFVYSKLRPHKDKLNEQNANYYNFLDKVYTPVLKVFGQSKPHQVGEGLALDMSQILLLGILLVMVLILAH